MNKKINFISIAVAILFSACSPSELVVKNLDKVEELEGQSFIYTLPRTAIKVEVELTETITKRGPFYNYAEQLLGERNVPRRDRVSWDLTGINITSYQTYDPEQIYVVWADKKANPDLSDFYHDGFVMPLSGDTLNGEDAITKCYIQPKIDEDQIFNQHSMKHNLVERTKTVYETIENDSTAYTVTKEQKRYSSRTIEEKAEAAEHNLIRLRKRRFKLLAAIEKNTIVGEPRDFRKAFPEGETMEIMLQELEKMESDLEALFLGKEIKRIHKRTFEVIPQNETLKNLEICSFSPSKGFLPTGSQDGIPVSITISKPEVSSVFNKLMTYNKDFYYNNIVYRIPEKTKVKVIMEDEMIATKEITISQFGTLLNVPYKK